MSGSAARALARVASRDIARHRGRSVLVILLVLLPVAAMVMAISIFRTTQTSIEQQDVARMGAADLIAMGVSREEAERHLPDGSVIEPFVTAEGRIVIPGARPIVTVRGFDLDGLGAGILTLTEGRKPQGAAEVAITPGVARLAGAGIGDALELADVPAPVTVVGVIENPTFLRDSVVLIDPASLPVADAEFETWLIGLPDGADPEAIVAATSDPQTGEFIFQSRASGRIGIMGEDSTSSTVLIMGALALVEAALIASAAFAVSIRRRQRELGLLAATGASPRQLAGTVVSGAVILGAIACLAGAVVGVVAALALHPFIDDLTQRRNGPLVVDAGGVVGPIGLGFVAAILAAVIPARTVARVPVLLALSGRRPPEGKARRTLWIGIGAVLLAAAMTFVGSTMRNAGSDSFSVLLLVGGAVLSVLGFGATGPWLLERLEAIATRLPLAGRIAFRDTARARSRSSPIVTAILAGCAAAIALGAWTTSRDAENLSGWVPALYPSQIQIAGRGAVATGEALAAEDDVIGGAPVEWLLPEDQTTYIAYELPDARDSSGREINLAEGCIEQGNCEPGAVIRFQASAPAAATPELLALAHAEWAAADLAAGRAVVLTNEDVTATTLKIIVATNPEIGEGFEHPENALTIDVPVRIVRAPVPGGILPGLFLPQSVVDQLPIAPMSTMTDYGEVPYIVEFDHPTTQADLDRVRAIAANYPETMADTMRAPERPGQEFRFVTIALVLLFAISVTGVAIALGEAESRSEQRSLLALGADPKLRRRIVAARAAVLALLAGILAVPAGLLPIWGIFVSRGSPLAVPTLEIAGAVLVLPLLAVLSAWLLSRPIPDWAAFRNLEAR